MENKKIDRRVRKTKTSIRSAFIGLLQKKPLSAITITEIMKNADLDRRTFYLHYGCIEDIIKEIEEEAIDSLNEVMSDSASFDMERFFQCLSQIINENVEFYRCITENAAYYEFQMQCKQILKNSLYHTFSSSDVVAEEDFEIYSEYIASGIMGIYINWLHSGAGTSLERLTKKAILVAKESWNKLSLAIDEV